MYTQLTFTMNNLKTFRLQTIFISFLRAGDMDFEVQLSAVTLNIYIYIYTYLGLARMKKNMNIILPDVHTHINIVTLQSC